MYISKYFPRNYWTKSTGQFYHSKYTLDEEKDLFNIREKLINLKFDVHVNTLHTLAFVIYKPTNPRGVEPSRFQRKTI